MALISTTPNGMQNLLDDFEEICNTILFKVNLEKTEYIIFNNTSEVEHYPFTYDQTPILAAPNGQFKYLGLTLDHQHIFEAKLTKNK